MGTLCTGWSQQAPSQSKLRSKPRKPPLPSSAPGGCECIAHIVQSPTDLDSNATIVSIDGVGAYDLISRNSMLRGLLGMENEDKILFFVRHFHGRLLTRTNLDTQNIPQGVTLSYRCCSSRIRGSSEAIA